MLKLFSHDDRFLIQQLRSELEREGIPHFIKNEYASGAVGELPWQDAQLEVWLVDDDWYDKAARIVSALNPAEVAPVRWRCNHCLEENEGHFDLCWKCQASRVVNDD
ncbi:DUF2007 domain-containing protein [Alteromonas sp. C1M14]|uniref:putative signal transducing protein n=1 Tax=Alteromonas sp. C1M14 TaxID=2841567 RepID=UPI001C0A2C3E|nr:DUF2007 domain-containing protein [Alteromonas sp. C1M14]MBU2979442.1 DUF2007 domain-containing protein [Alteromonas sp. C1M14]